jgi:hypothetical protein
VKFEREMGEVAAVTPLATRAVMVNRRMKVDIVEFCERPGGDCAFDRWVKSMSWILGNGDVSCQVG